MKLVRVILFLVIIALPSLVLAASPATEPSNDHEAILLIEQRLTNIESNHLIHIQDSVAEISKQMMEIKIWQAKVAVWGGLAVFVATMMSQLIVKQLEKKLKI